MTQLLVSLRSATEALTALDGGADWIDVKEPSRGSLGAADVSTVEEVIGAVHGRTPVSMACGELQCVETPGVLTGVRLAKCGLAGSGTNWRQYWLRWSKSLPTSCKAVLVAYAEESRVNAPLVPDIVSFALEVRPAAVLIDTALKDNRSLLDHWPAKSLTNILQPLAQASIPVALAGSVRLEQLAELLSLGPGWIAVRGAVCDGDRNGVVSVEKVRQFKEEIKRLQPRLVGNLDKS